MRSMNIREARRKFSVLMDDAERGRSVLITRRGRKVARIAPAGPTVGGPLPDLSDFRRSIESKGEPLSKIVAESRKQARY